MVRTSVEDMLVDFTATPAASQWYKSNIFGAGARIFAVGRVFLSRAIACQLPPIKQKISQSHKQSPISYVLPLDDRCPPNPPTGPALDRPRANPPPPPSSNAPRCSSALRWDSPSAAATFPDTVEASSHGQSANAALGHRLINRIQILAAASLTLAR